MRDLIVSVPDHCLSFYLKALDLFHLKYESYIRILFWLNPCFAYSLKFGLEVFSTSENYTEYRSKFGDKRIGMVILNSCTNDLVIVRKILDLYKYGIDEDQKGRRNITDRVLGECYYYDVWISKPFVSISKRHKS